MTLHKRHDQTTQASIEIKQAVVAAAQKHELTFAELIAILAEIMQSWTKGEIREERAQEMQQPAYINPNAGTAPPDVQRLSANMAQQQGHLGTAGTVHSGPGRCDNRNCWCWEAVQHA